MVSEFSRNSRGGLTKRLDGVHYDDHDKYGLLWEGNDRHETKDSAKKACFGDS